MVIVNGGWWLKVRRGKRRHVGRVAGEWSPDLAGLLPVIVVRVVVRVVLVVVLVVIVVVIVVLVAVLIVVVAIHLPWCGWQVSGRLI